MTQVNVNSSIPMEHELGAIVTWGLIAVLIILLGCFWYMFTLVTRKPLKYIGRIWEDE